MPTLSLRLRIISLLLRTAAWVWRRLLFRTVFIGITGSVGKTTAKDCVAACLATVGPVSATIGNRNCSNFGLAKSILRVRPWHRFAVIEIGAGLQGQFRRSARILVPDIALIVAVAQSHTKSFPTLEDVAREKQQLLEFLRPRGLVFINGDDPYVSAMSTPPDATVLRFGCSPEHDYRAEDASATWPQRLSFTALRQGEAMRMDTNLVGVHWVPSVLGAIAVAHRLGVRLDAAAAALRTVSPGNGRMEPVELDGATFLRNDFKGSVATFQAALPVLREAKVQRRVLICGDLSDSGIHQRKRAEMIGLAAKESADLAIFVGRLAGVAQKHALNAGMRSEKAHAFLSLEDAAAFVRDVRQPGDLLLLIGQTSDHVSRILHAQLGPVSCWKPICRIPRTCDACSRLRAIESA